MTKLLDRAFEVARKLPPQAQDDIASVVLQLAAVDAEEPVPLTEEESNAIANSEAAAERGEFASQADVRAVWAKHLSPSAEASHSQTAPPPPRRG